MCFYFIVMRKLLITAACFAFFYTHAQTDKVRKGQFKINFLAPGAEYELGLSDKTTLVIESGIGLAYAYSSSFGSDFITSPYFALQYRYYYNFNKRVGKDKNTLNNSANYISFIGGISPGYYSFADSHFIENVGGTIGPAWGFQRTYNSGFNLSLDLGVGYAYEEKGAMDIYYPLSGFRSVG